MPKISVLIIALCLISCGIPDPECVGKSSQPDNADHPGSHCISTSPRFSEPITFTD